MPGNGRFPEGFPHIGTRERAMAAKAKVKTGDDVTYTWGKGTVTGTVTEVHTRDVAKTIKGKRVKRAASKEKPAVEIETAKGGTVLKSASEVAVK